MTHDSIRSIKIESMIARLQADPRLRLSDNEMREVLDQHGITAWHAEVQAGAASRAAMIKEAELEQWGQVVTAMLLLNGRRHSKLNARSGIAIVDAFVQSLQDQRVYYREVRSRSKTAARHGKLGRAASLTKQMEEATSRVAQLWSRLSDREKALFDPPYRDPPQSPFDYGDPCDPEFYLFGCCAANSAQLRALKAALQWDHQTLFA